MHHRSRDAGDDQKDRCYKEQKGTKVVDEAGDSHVDYGDGLLPDG